MQEDRNIKGGQNVTTGQGIDIASQIEDSSDEES